MSGETSDVQTEESLNEDDIQAKKRRKSKWDAGLKNEANSTPTIAIPGALILPQLLVPQHGLAEFQRQMIAQQVLQAFNPVMLQRPVGITAPVSAISHRVYVGSIHYDLKESDIVALFSSFGTITKSDMSMDPQTGRSKGFCFIEYADPAAAEAAQAMDGFELAGRKIKVGRPLHGQAGPGAAPAATAAAAGLPLMGGAVPMVPMMPTQHLLAHTMGLLGTGLPMGGGGLIPNFVPPPPAGKPVEAQKSNFLLIRNIPSEVLGDDLISIFEPFGKIEKCTVHDSVNGGSKGAPSSSSASGATNGSQLKFATIEYRDASAAATAEATMNNFKLGTALLSLKAVTKEQAAADALIRSGGGKSVLLENMVTLEDTADPDLKEEISEEARRYGALRAVELVIRAEGDRDTKDGQHAVGSVQVVLRYETPADAAKACAALSNRAFANRRIKATLAP